MKRAAARPTVPPLTQAAVIDERELATQRLEETIERCIELLSFSVELLIESPGRINPGRINESMAILEIRRLCDLVGKPAPEFKLSPLAPKPPKKSHCINCGNELTEDDIGEWCIHCESEEIKQQRMAEARKQREMKARRTRYLYGTMKGLSRDIRDLEKKMRRKWKAPPT
jgi:hypothetical protein